MALDIESQLSHIMRQMTGVDGGMDISANNVFFQYAICHCLNLVPLFDLTRYPLIIMII